jgi:hypothetical protein
MQPFNLAETSPTRDLIQLGVITSLVMSDEGDTGVALTYSGLYNVVLTHTGRKIYNVSAVQDSYSYNTNTGVIRLYEKGDPVLVVRLADDRYLIVGCALIPDKNGSAPLPRVGAFNKPLSPGELYIGGVNKPAPIERSSYIHFDKTGNIDISSSKAFIRFKNASSLISIKSQRFESFNSSGYESWGSQGLSGAGTPAFLPKPGQWRHLVRTVSNDNISPFSYTEAGRLEPSALPISADPTSTIYMHNINNAAVVAASVSGRYSITAGMPPSNSSLIKHTAATFKPVQLLAPMILDLDPLTSAVTLRGPYVQIVGGLTGAEGIVQMRGLNTDLIAASRMTLTSLGVVAITGADVTITAPTTKFVGNVVVVGSLSVSGTVDSPMVNTGYINAPNVP